MRSWPRPRPPCRSTSGIEALEGELAAAQKETAELRTKASESRTELITLEREHRARSERQTAIVAERERWQTRSAGAGEQIATLKERIAETQGEVATHERPARHDRAAAPETDERAGQGRAGAPGRRRRARRRRSAHRQAAQELRAAQAAVSDEREARARIETRLEGARARRSEEARKIRDQLGCAPEGCLALAELPAGRQPAAARGGRQPAHPPQGRSRAAGRRQPAGRRRPDQP